MKFNARLFIVHFAAAFCMKLSFRILAAFIDISLFKEIRYRSTNGLHTEGLILSDILSLAISIGLIETIGLVISFLISMRISFKRDLGWVTPVLVFMIIYLLGWLDVRGYSMMRFLNLLFSRLINDIRLEVLTTGFLLLACSLLLFFSKRTNRFINGASTREVIT